jgi:hypothetical protein
LVSDFQPLVRKLISVILNHQVLTPCSHARK